MTLNNLTEPCTLLLEQALKIPVQHISTITSPLNNAGGYDWRDTKMYLAQQLPQSPAEANVYLLKSQPASMDDARALAQRFGINSEPQETLREFPENFNYLVTDGKQRLQIRSDHYFTY